MLFTSHLQDQGLEGALLFFDRIGVFSVVLPFLLVFVVVFAILEKTKVYGMEKVGGQEYSRKNLNAMTAFVVAFFVVASSRLVAVINETLAWTVLLLILILSYMLLVGAFHDGSKPFELDETWKKIFMIAVLVAIILIFLNALGWLGAAWNFILYNWNSTVVSAIGLIIFIVLFIGWVTRDRKPDKS